MPASANTKQSAATRANPIHIDTIQQEPTYQPKDLATGSRAWALGRRAKPPNP